MKEKKHKRHAYNDVYDSHWIKGIPNTVSPKAIIHQSELDFISRCILDYPNIETGGELFGFWTQMGTPVVLYAGGPGPNAKHHLTSFIQDSEYVDNIEVDLCNLTGIQHIGQWHSHHQLSLAYPSGGDVKSIMKGVGSPGFPRMFILCIGNCTATTTTINAFNFHENCFHENPPYVYAIWDVIAIDSPYRTAIDMLFAGQLYKPRTLKAAYGEMNILTKRPFKTEKKYHQHWLTERVENVETMKGFVQSAKLLFNDSDPSTEILDSGEPIISLYSGLFRIMLPYGFPNKAPRYVTIEGERCNEDYRIYDDTAQVWNELSYSLDSKFQEWLKLTLSNVVSSYVKQPEITDNSIQNIDNFQPEIALADDRFNQEKKIIESSLPKLNNSYKFYKKDNGDIIFENEVFHVNGEYKIVVRIIRDSKYNFISAECRRLIPEIPPEETPFRSLLDITPSIADFFTQKVTYSTTELELFKMISMLVHQSEDAELNNTNINEIIKQITYSNNIYANLMEKEQHFFNLNK